MTVSNKTEDYIKQFVKDLNDDIKNQSANDVLPATTAGIHPELFSDDLAFAKNRKIAAIVLAVFILIGFGLRTHDLGSESFGEDELNKLQTVEEYRSNGLSGKNGEHPFLMKGLQTISVIAAAKINDYIASPQSKIPDEAALRFPVALIGTFTTLLIFLLMSELFGRSIGLVSACLWAVEPLAVGFDRIAKEDSLVLFFFLLTFIFWIKGQTAAERGNKNWTWYAWAAAASFAGLMASKYYPHLLAIVGAYYIIFQSIPETKWRMESVRWLKFLAVMGVSFIILNPTIILPDTWREMLKFSAENRIGHGSYEFMGSLYVNKMSAWLSGVPWTFYYVFIAVKTSFVVLVFFLIGLPLMFKRRLGDGRFFIFFWAFMWFLPFTFLGGKFMRYFTLVEPLILIAAAVGFYFSVKWLTARLPFAPVFQTVLFLLFLGFPLWNSISATPHFRLFTNELGGGKAAAGSYFPHDEFYDAATRETVAEIAQLAKNGAVVACETPALFEYYAWQAGITKLEFVSLSDKTKVTSLKERDFIVVARGRRYFSNTAYIDLLRSSAISPVEIYLNETPAAAIYRLDSSTLVDIYAIAR